MQADGFSLDDKRSAVAENDIPDIVERFHNLEGEKSRSRTDKSFLVPKCEIVSNEYDLSINKYKKVEYVAENFPEPCEILAEIDSLMDSLSTGLAELRGLV
jgi:type I restriction enzyme M protein